MNTLSINLPPNFSDEDLRRVITTLISKINDLQKQIEDLKKNG